MDHDEIRVHLGERSYPILIGSGVRTMLPALMKERGLGRRAVVITDRNVSRHHGKKFTRHLTEGGYDPLTAVVPPGEQQKSLRTTERITGVMLKAGIGRGDIVIALGGGVIGDLAGFVAATYHRGIQLIQVPTTLLAQVDSSIGGKTGVNHPLGKNMIGAFHQPQLVVADPDFLRTLPRREIVCGLGESVKYGIILDETLFSFLEHSWRSVAGLDTEALRYVVHRCAELKAGLVSRDEKEAGERVILNCGHTIGHALEAWGQFRRYKHGEAVLLGLAAESHVAEQLGHLSRSDKERIVGLITQFPLNRLGLPRRGSDILPLITRDKKARNSRNRFVLPARVGGTVVVEGVPEEVIRDSVRFLTTLKFGLS